MSLVKGYSSDSGSDSDSDSDSGTDSKPDVNDGILSRLSEHVVENPKIDSDSVYSTVTNNFMGKDAVGGKIEKVYVEKGMANSKRNHERPRSNKRKKQKRNKGDLDDIYLGPWASFDDEYDHNTPKETNDETEPTEEEEEEEVDGTQPDNQPDDQYSTSEYLATFNYPNGDFLAYSPIKTLRNECFVPKKVIHKFPGHENGISKLEFFPQSGHLLLSGGNDSIIRLWDLYNKRELIREYYGHNQPIKDLIFNSDGKRFLSSSFDKKVHLWDTKTGEILKTLTFNSTPTALLFNSNNDDEFLVGLMTGKIEHYHIKDLSNPLQVYDHHLSIINSLCPVQNGQKFLSASDDKSVRIWNWGINIPVKIITHPTQYAIASVVSLPPNDKYIAMQNMNNTIQVIDGEGKYKFKKKQFKNPNITGYKIEIHISPDGKILMSGDSKGNVLFWDWNSGKLVSLFKISDKMINNIKFHPQELSKVVAGGIDGKIYYCD